MTGCGASVPIASTVGEGEGPWTWKMSGSYTILFFSPKLDKPHRETSFNRFGPLDAFVCALAEPPSKR